MDYALLLPAKAPIRMHDTLPDLVARSALMRGTSDAALSLLKRARLSLRTLAAGEIVFRPGDAAEAVYLLLGARTNADGLDVDPLVQVELKPATGKRLLRFERIVHGEIFGELEFLEQGMLPKGAKRTTSAFALTPAAVVPLPLSLFAELLDADGVIRSRVIRIGSQRLVAALMQQHEKVHTFPDLLLADWLVELSADIGIAEGNRVRFPRKIAQKHIAADLGVSRETISRRLNEWERSGLLRTGARSQQIEILDYQRISRLASLRSARSRSALERTIDDIDAAIACGEVIRARNIGLDIMRYYASSPELIHRTALAAARGGDARGALDLLARSGLPMMGPLSTLEDAVSKARKNPFLPMDRILSEPFVDDGYGEDDGEAAIAATDASEAEREAQLVEDLAALNARLLKEHAFEATRSSDRKKQAMASFSAYHGLYEHSQGYYPGVNAATMALIAGNAEIARQIAGALIAELDAGRSDYWPLATLAEALLIVGREAEAEEVLAKASTARGADDGAKASTILQFRRLGTVLDADIEALVSALRPRSVAVFSGHLFRGNELDQSTQSAIEADIRAAAEPLFAEHNVGIVYGALAAGTDIVLAETALASGAELDVVLPFPTERFVETSVKIGDPPGKPGTWEKRFRTILESQGVRALTIMDPNEPVERDLDAYFFYAFRYAAGCALQRAATLQTNCRLLVVADGGGPDTVAGANRVLDDWREHGRPFDLIRYPHPRIGKDQREADIAVFRPVVFLWDAAPGIKTGNGSLDRLFKSAGKGRDGIERTHRDGRRGLCLTAGSTAEALDMGRQAVKAARDAKRALRVICDFGLVQGAKSKPDKKLIAHLQSADDFFGLPTDCVLATEAYAAQAKFDLGDRILLIPVGRAEVQPTSEERERQAIRSRPTLPVFTVEWASGRVSPPLDGPKSA
ncbi:MAG TPA: Crp/Fnr family transcriptional regulator [Methyloceanibacter sp.]|nr:Crp/Fnr family transcriptional regulator [Methyloceanibacter sp.]